MTDQVLEEITWKNIKIKLGELKPWSENPRFSTRAQADKILKSFKIYGQVIPFAISPENDVYDGHQRLSALLTKYGENHVVDARRASRMLTDDERKQLIIFLHSGAVGSWDWEKIKNWNRDQIAEWGMDFDAVNTWKKDATILNSVIGAVAPGPASDRGSLADQFIIPPFSVLDARQGYWQARKRAWIELGIQSEIGRGDNLLLQNEQVTTENLEFYRKAKRKKFNFPDDHIGEDGKFHTGDLHKGYERDDDGNTVRPAVGAGALKDSEQFPDPLARKKAYDQNKNGLLGFSEQARSHYRKGNSPGGSPRPAAKTVDGHTVRGDGHGRELATSFSSQASLTALQRTGDSHGEVFGTEGNISEQTGTSIFDPVLCEIAYRWFMPRTGAVLDPFAGGSVRGIVAAKLGYSYTGIDLRKEQIDANNVQAKAILRKAGKAEPESKMVTIKISAASANLIFKGCSPDYIKDVCHASCCDSSTSPTGTMITINPAEQKKIEKRGGVVIDGLLQPREGERKCPFKSADHLCSIHFTPDKPFGCIASPFTLNKNGTLIVRNRYKLLKCYKEEGGVPAYQAFRASLDLIFGKVEAERICQHLAAGGGDIPAQIKREVYNTLLENDEIKHGAPARPPVISTPAPNWVVGDSRNIKTLAPGSYDFIFSCPPYFDLELYSDIEGDLSNMGTYKEFIKTYRQIIFDSVAMLKDDRFACFVVGDIRDKRGFYRNFPADTIRAFEDAGMTLYNEAILLTAIGSLPIRAGRAFQSGRKLGKTHQNVLIFYKGDPKAIKNFGDVECGDMIINEQIDDAQ